MNAFAKIGASREHHFGRSTQAEGAAAKSRMLAGEPSIAENTTAIDRLRGNLKVAAPKVVQVRDYKIALQLLERASTGVDDLSEKLRKAEAERDMITEQLNRYKQMERQWLSNMESANSRLEQMEGEVSSLSEKLISETNRSNTIKANLAESEANLKAAEERNSELESDCKALHDSIVSTFGVESTAYKTLNSDLHRK